VTVELRGFGWRHAGRKAWAVRDVDLRIERGERVLLLGPSGSGKSTLLAALAGLLPDDSGERAGEVCAPPRGRVGILFQDPETQLALTRAGDDVAFGLENTGVPTAEIWPRVDAALAEVGFPYGRDRHTNQLSGGEQQRLALAGVLALRPELLLLDEPTANLDPDGAALVREALSRILADRERTMILVEHRVAESLSLVDRVVALAPGGGLLADGPPDEVFAAHGPALAERGVWVPGLPLPRRQSSGPAGSPVLTAADVQFRDRLPSTHALVRAAEAFAVVGSNGSGKTTLARVLGGLVAPTAGRVSVAGESEPPYRWPARKLAQRIGSVFQDPEHQFLTNNVRAEVAFGGASSSTADDLLDRLRLAHLASANPYTLSGGEQRRLSVATVLAAAPQTLILDEPTFGQDRRTWLELLDLLATLRDEGRALVTVTHDADFVSALADRTLRLERPC
jgi:energy-coupling factor transport system ATP-binding protein